MRRNMKWFLVLGVAAVLTGCATSGPEIVQPTPSDHSHRHSEIVVLGSGENHFHVINFMNRRAAKIGIQILDRYEEPYYLQEQKIRAKVTREDGSEAEFYLTGEGYRAEDWDTVPPYGATVFSKRFDWVQDAHHVDLKAWVPMPDGKTYELEFQCVAREPYSG